MKKKKDYAKLFESIFIDCIGMTSYFVPVIGESFDLIWAPISAVLVQKLYGNKVLSIIAGIEEALPGTDIIPTATIGWFIEK